MDGTFYFVKKKIVPKYFLNRLINAREKLQGHRFDLIFQF